jgi:hypothetical protein
MFARQGGNAPKVADGSLVFLDLNAQFPACSIVRLK